MPYRLQRYHRIRSMERTMDGRTISTYYKYNGKNSTYVFFVNDNTNLYVETQFGSIVIPFADCVKSAKYARLYVYYIISLQLTPIQSNIYYCSEGYKGQYKESRNWYLLSNICWKSQYMSFGDYCYFKENPLDIALTTCATADVCDAFLSDLKKNEYECPYIICDWLINYEANLIERELFQNEVIVKDEKNTYALLQIIKNHFKINEDVILKIYEYIVFDSDKYDIVMI